MPDQYATTLQTLTAELRAADAWRDTDLTVEAQQRRRETMRADAIAKARAAIVPAAESAARAAAKASQTARQALGGGSTDPGRLIAREQAWRRVEMLLAAGRDLTDVIATTTDPLTLEAVAEWGPTWARAQTVRPDREVDAAGWHGFTEPDVADVEAAVLDRLADVAEDPAPFVAARDSAAEAQRTDLYAQTLQALEDGRSLPGDLRNRLHAADVEAYRAITGTA